MIESSLHCDSTSPIELMRDDALGQHYTGSDVANALSALMRVHKPATVIDLGVGEGSLLMGAKNHWRGAKLHGFDIDQCNLDIARSQLGRGTFGKVDCLAATLPRAIKELLSSADVVLCNPPFLEFTHAAAKFAVPQDWRQTAEVKFFEISLQLLRPGGSLGIILPARYISGPAYREFRRQLLSTCNVVSVTHLPVSTFKTAEVDTYFVVLRKEPPNGKVLLQVLGGECQYASTICLIGREAIERLDHRYHAGLSDWVSSSVPLSILLTQDISRGVDSCGRKTPDWIFHTTNFKMFPQGRIHCPPTKTALERGLAVPGDILIPRVGSRCLHYCAQIVSGQTTFSDCVYRLRVSPEWRAYVFNYLRSPVGIAMRSTSAHGSCVKVLGKQTLLDLPIPMLPMDNLEST
jgi:type I restriction enzyme M protein